MNPLWLCGDDDFVPHAMTELRGHVFGLDLRGSAPVPGVLPTPAGDGSRPCLVRLVESEELAELWAPRRAESVLRQRSPAGTRTLDADLAADGRWLVHLHGVARCVVEADGSAVWCLPTVEAGPRWSRFVTGQALPLAAVLQGLEPFHASAVAVGEASVGIVGASYAGKTTLAMALVMRGAALVTDDVLVMEASGDGVVTHPGAHLANVRHATVALLTPSRLEALGTEVSRDEHGIRLAVQVPGTVQPLRVLYFLERREDGARGVSFEPIPAPDPRMLLGASFNLAVLEPGRLARQLDVCWRISQTATLMRVTAAATVHPAELAGLVEADACSRVT